MLPNESLNNLMKHIGNRARNMSPALRHARILIKSYVNKHDMFRHNYNGRGEQFRSLQKVCAKLVNKCMSIGASAKEQRKAMDEVLRDPALPPPEIKSLPLALCDGDDGPRTPQDEKDGKSTHAPQPKKRAKVHKNKKELAEEKPKKFELVWRASINSKRLQWFSTWTTMLLDIQTSGCGHAKETLASYISLVSSRIP